jgi:hypothetical protein
MRRTGLLLAIAMLTSSISPALADPGHEKPKITVMRWKDAPVTANEPGCEKAGTCVEEILIIKAHDPDSSITEIQVWFDENGKRAPFVFAHTSCVQGREPGQVARLELGVAYTEPGTYVVAAVAYSHRRCSGHEAGDRHPSLHSRVFRLETEVGAPT